MGHTVKKVEQYPLRIEALFEMLQHRRPAWSKTEEEFIDEYIRPYRPYQDQKGNLFVKIEGQGQNILWSSHTDTVHTHDGKQSLFITHDGFVCLSKDSLPKGVKDHKGSSCLGADDGAGVWLMLNMIEAGKPGLYVFHRAEERGAIGSRYIANETPEVLEGIDAAIAFDRYGYKSVITHQCGRCCSDEFAKSLISALPDIPGLEPDSGGIFTDTKCYIDIVPECTNISVGYFGHHTTEECVDLYFLDKLRRALIKMDPTKLVIKRTPGERDYTYSGWGSRAWGFRSSSNREIDEGDETLYLPSLEAADSATATLTADLDERAATEKEASDLGFPAMSAEEEGAAIIERELYDMAAMIERDPDGAAEMLYDLGIRYDDLCMELDVELH